MWCVALIDQADIELVKPHCWRPKIIGKGRLAYVRRWRGKPSLMHSLITGFPYVDHINNNGLDNRRRNLRTASPLGNARNCRANSQQQVSLFKGVTFHRPSKKWYARISINGKRKHIGVFCTETEAAEAYDAAALWNHGAFAKTNKMLGLL